MLTYIVEVLWSDGTGDGGYGFDSQAEAEADLAEAIAEDPTIERGYVTRCDGDDWTLVTTIPGQSYSPARCICGDDHDCRSAGCDEQCTACSGEACDA